MNCHKKIFSVVLSSCIIGSTASHSFALPPSENTHSAFSTVSSFLKGAYYLGNVQYLARSLVSSARSYLKNKYNFSKKSFRTDRIAVDEKLKTLFHEIKGQKKAKVEIEGLVNSILDDLTLSTNGQKNKGHIIYIIGPSGVGKSMVAAGIADALLEDNSSRLVIDAGCVDTSDKAHESVKQQLLGINDDTLYFGDSLYPQSKQIIKTVSIAQHIMENPKTVVILNEYDKFFDKDMDEVLRQFHDEGVIHSNGHVIDCSNVVFIITSNEHKDCVTTQKKKKTSDESQSESLSSESTGKTNDDNRPLDGTTKREHDISFLNRLSVSEFLPLENKDYKEIANDFLKNCSSKYEEHYKIKLLFDDECLEAISKFAQDSNQGARAITSALAAPLSLAVNKLRRSGISGEFGIKYYNNGEAKSGNFELTRKFNKEEVECAIQKASDYIKDDEKSKETGDVEFLSDEEKNTLSQQISKLQNCNSQNDFNSDTSEAIDKIQSILYKVNLKIFAPGGPQTDYII